MIKRNSFRENSRLSVASRESSLNRPPRTLNSRRERSLSSERPVTQQQRHRSLSRDKERYSDSDRGRQARPFMRGTASSRERLVLRDRARSTSRERSFTSTGSKHRSPSPSLGTPLDSVLSLDK